MTIARRPSPFGELLSLRQAMDRLFEDSFVRSPTWANGSHATTTTPIDLSMTSDELVVRAVLPGVNADQVDITIENGTLTIRGEVASERQEGEGDYLVQEIRRGAFSRSIGLPNGLEPDRASATFENGVLSLRIPKANEVMARQIRISPSAVGGNSTTGGNGTSTTGDHDKAG